MAITGKQTINIGLPNESTGSDSLYTAFTKAKDNFDVLFANASPFNTFNPGDGINVTANSGNGAVTITNTGVTQLNAGTGIVLTGNTGNITISSTGGGGGNGGGTVTSVAVAPVSNTRLVVTGSPIVSAGNIFLDLATTGINAGSYSNPLMTVDAYGRVTGISNGAVVGTVTSVGLTPGFGIQINGGPITSNGNITVTNTGVTRINAGSGISVSSGNGNVTISATSLGGTVTSVGISSTQLVVSGSPVVNSGTISVNLPNSATFTGTVTAGNVRTDNLLYANGTPWDLQEAAGTNNQIQYNSGNNFAASANLTFDPVTRILNVIGNVAASNLTANFANINGNLVVIGNISPAANNKVGGIKPGPGVNVSLDGELTIDGANLPINFGNFTANNNVLSIVNVDEDMILQTEGNAEIQLIGNIGFYKPDGLPPNVANRYFYATSDGTVNSKYLDIQSFGDSGIAAPFNVTIDTTGNYRPPAVLNGTIAQFTGNGNVRSYIVQDNYGVDGTFGTGGQYVFRTGRGNVDTPAAVQTNDRLGEIAAAGWASNGYGGQGSGFYRIVANENFTSTARGGRLELWVVPNGTITETKIATVDSNGLSVTGIANISGNANVGNIGAASGIFTANANVGNLFSSGAITSNSASAGVGYRTGAGGTVTQLTDKSTAVTLNTITGEITMNGAQLGGDATVSFTLNNSTIANTDVIIINQVSTANRGEYAFNGHCNTGNAVISVHNMTNTNRSDAIVLRYAVIKAATA